MPGLFESKYIANHKLKGRGSSLRSERMQKKRLGEYTTALDSAKDTTARKLYSRLSVVAGAAPGEDNPSLILGIKVSSMQELWNLHRRAFILGLKAADEKLNISREDAAWLRDYTNTEQAYFEKFFAAIQSGSLSLAQIRHRVSMYMNSTDGTFEAGRVVGANPNSLLWWVMDVNKEHCDVCKFLTANSPYTVATLPTVPRAGSCRGYGNCGCRLSIIPADPDVIRAANSRSKSKQQLLAVIQRMRSISHVA